MLTISKISFGGFKNIKAIELDFTSNNPTALISSNNYGKSNVLTALGFISNYLSTTPSVREQMMCDIECIPINVNTANDDFVATLSFDYTDYETAYVVEYTFSFCWATQKIADDNVEMVEGHIKTEKLARKINGSKQKFQTLINRYVDDEDSVVALYKASETGRCSSKISNLDKNDLVLNRLSIVEGLYYTDLINELRKIKFYIERHLDARFAFEVTPLRLKTVKPFDLVSENNQLPRTLWNLRQNKPELYKSICSLCTRLFPDIAEVHAERCGIDLGGKTLPDNAPYMLDDAVYVLLFRNPSINQEISFEQVSDGVKRIILTLTNLELARINGVQLIAIEEPENSIHPKLLKEYMGAIAEYAKDFRIVFSSHSPYLISCMEDIESILIGLPNNDGLAIFGKLFNRKGFLKLLEQRHEKSGTAIFNLLCETESDEPCKLAEFWG